MKKLFQTAIAAMCLMGLAGCKEEVKITEAQAAEPLATMFFDYTVPTKDLEFRLDELSKDSTALSNIDAIIAGMRVLNQRGDTDLVKRQLDQILEHGVELGTRASQSIASFLMFEVKDNDPFLRRFGKYINLETARAYNANDRKVMNVTYDEYVFPIFPTISYFALSVEPVFRIYIYLILLTRITSESTFCSTARDTK